MVRTITTAQLHTSIEATISRRCKKEITTKLRWKHKLIVVCAGVLLNFQVFAEESSFVKAEACVFDCDRNSGEKNAAARIKDDDYTFSGSAQATAGYNSGIFKTYAQAEQTVPEGSRGGYDPLLRPWGVYGLADVKVVDRITLASTATTAPNWLIKFRTPTLDGTLSTNQSIWVNGDQGAYFEYKVTIGSQSYSYHRSTHSFFGESETSNGSLTFAYLAGAPVKVSVEVTSRAYVQPRATCLGGVFCKGGSSDAEAEFSHTMSWGGIDEIVSAVDGAVINDWALTSDSGTDWSKAALAVPESSTFLYMLAGGLLIFAIRKFGPHAWDGVRLE